MTLNKTPPENNLDYGLAYKDQAKESLDVDMRSITLGDEGSRVLEVKSITQREEANTVFSAIKNPEIQKASSAASPLSQRDVSPDFYEPAASENDSENDSEMEEINRELTKTQQVVRRSCWSEFLDSRNSSSDDSPTPPSSRLRSTSSSSGYLRVQSRLSMDDIEEVKSDFSDQEQRDFEKLIDRFDTARSHHQVCKRMKKASDFIHKKIPDSPIGQSRNMKRISDGLMPFSMQLAEHMPGGVKETDKYCSASPAGRVLRRVRASFNLFASKRLKQGKAFANLIDAINLKVDSLRRQEAIYLLPNTSLKDLGKILNVSPVSNQVFWNREFRELPEAAIEELTLLDMIKYEENERYVIPIELKEKVSAKHYAYEPGELELYQKNILEENRSRLVKRGCTKDKIEEYLQMLDDLSEVYRHAESLKHVSEWIKKTNTERQTRLREMRSEYKSVEVALASTTILEFPLRGGQFKTDKYIFEIIEGEKKGTEIIVARLFFDKNDDARALRPKGKRLQAQSPLFLDADTSA